MKAKKTREYRMECKLKKIVHEEMENDEEQKQFLYLFSKWTVHGTKFAISQMRQKPCSILAIEQPNDKIVFMARDNRNGKMVQTDSVKEAKELCCKMAQEEK